MALFIQMFIQFIILFLGNHFFPSTIVFTNGWESILLTVLWFFVADLIYVGVIAIIHTITATFDLEDSIGALIILLLALVWTPLKIFLVSYLYAGFEIVGGFLPYLILTIVFFLFTGKK